MWRALLAVAGALVVAGGRCSAADSHANVAHASFRVVVKHKS